MTNKNIFTYCHTLFALVNILFYYLFYFTCFENFINEYYIISTPFFSPSSSSWVPPPPPTPFQICDLFLTIIVIHTHTHTTNTIYYVHLALLICIYIKGWPLKLFPLASWSFWSSWNSQRTVASSPPMDFSPLSTAICLVSGTLFWLSDGRSWFSGCSWCCKNVMLVRTEGLGI